MKITVRGSALVLTVLVLAGCDRADPRLKDLTVGIAKDSAVAVMDGPPNVVEPFLVNAQYIEGLYYAKPGKTDSASKTPRKMTPLVLIDGKVIGWGWPFWDSVAAANKIPVAPKN